MPLQRTWASQTGAPNGFSCVGLTKVVGVDQTMGPNSACEEVALAKSDPCLVEDKKGIGWLPMAAVTSRRTRS